MAHRLSVFIPAYNEEANLEVTIHELETALHAQLDLSYEIIIVNDGSSDRTGAIADALAQADRRIRVVHNPKNLGLAQTFWVGARAASFEFIGWVPADNGFPAESLKRWLAPLGKADLIQIYLLNPEVRYLARRIISRTYARTMKLLFGIDLKYYTGIQIYRRELLLDLETHASSFAVLTEILVKLLTQGIKYIEVGVKMQERTGGASKAVTFQNISNVLITVIRLLVEVKLIHRRRYWSRGIKIAWAPPQEFPLGSGPKVGAMGPDYGQPT